MFEYFLYAAIIAETALAAFVFKTILRDPDLARFNFYFGVFYAGFLAWSIWQLNKVHHRRKLPEGQPAADPVPEQAAKPMLGLTAAQLAIIAAVFVTAVATFSWGLRLLR